MPRSFDAIQADLHAAQAIESPLEAAHREKIRQELAAAGVCPDCDSQGYIEYRGFDDYWSMACKRCGGSGDLYRQAQTIRQQKPAVELQVIREEIRNLQAEYREVQRLVDDPRGLKVRVVRGRKVPIGTEGVCFWVGASQYGQRVGIRLEDQSVVWVAAGNISLVWD